MVFLYCLNDQLWQKALTQNPSCKIDMISITSHGANYSLDCPNPVMHLRGKVQLIFDGMTHMTGNGQVDITANGNTTHSTSRIDYHWKSSTCGPNDMNLRQTRPH